MSFQNLNSHSQVNAASRSPLIPPVETSSHRAEQSEEKEVLPQERKPSQGTTKFSIRDAAEGFFFFFFLGAGTQEPEPRFLWAKAALSVVVVVVFIQPQPRQKMNRSFHKSQPLRNVDCNAVEVKSKVGLKWRGLWVCWRFLGGGGGVEGGGSSHGPPVP